MNQPAEEPIPENIRRLIVNHVHSVESLEVLLLLFSQPAEQATPMEVSRKLYTTLASAAARLKELQQSGLLTISKADPPSYQFNHSSAQASLVGDLEKIYKQRRVSIISFIYSKPSDPLRAFSDAFRLRKDEP